MSVCCAPFPGLSRSLAADAEKSAVPAPAANQIVDVALVDGVLSGQLLDRQGRPLAAQSVALRDGRGAGTAGLTNAQGQFRFRCPRGGVFQLTAAQHGVRLRAWSERAAPPHAVHKLLVVVGDVQRGQRPISQMIDKRLLLGLGVAAAIAIPLALDDDDEQRLGS